MTSWKARMLDELFLATEALFERGAEGPSSRASSDRRSALRVDEVTRTALALSSPEAAARASFLPSYLASLPERYLLANPTPAIVAHADLARAQAAKRGDVELARVPSRHPEAAEICVAATDRPGLLAAITAAFAASRLEVHAAEIHSREVEPGFVQALDLFWVRDRGEGVEGVDRAIPNLVRDIRAVLAGDVDATELARRRGTSAWGDRPSPHVAARVALDPAASSRHTVLEVVARDRPGLLFTVAGALHKLGLSIAVAKINTEGTRVADVFYVSEADGSKIAPGRRSQEIHDGVQAALDRLEEGTR
jgi:[protein-PII] uridylyltransferase